MRWKRKFLFCFTSCRRTAVTPSASACVSAEVVALLLFLGNLRRETYGKQVVGQAATWESGCLWAPVSRWLLTRLCKEVCQKRQDSARAFSGTVHCSLTLALTCLQMAECPGWGWPAQWAQALSSARDALQSGHLPRFVQFGNSVHCSFSVSILQG